eukprot:1558561-Rhodomonas_salina.1
MRQCKLSPRRASRLQLSRSAARSAHARAAHAEHSHLFPPGGRAQRDRRRSVSIGSDGNARIRWQRCMNARVEAMLTCAVAGLVNAVAFVVKKFGGLDTLVNGAAGNFLANAAELAPKVRSLLGRDATLQRVKWPAACETACIAWHGCAPRGVSGLSVDGFGAREQ